MYFKEKVVQLRKDASMTQEFFAQEVGVSRQAVYKWEKGLSYPEAEKLILIAKRPMFSFASGIFLRRKRMGSPASSP